MADTLRCSRCGARLVASVPSGPCPACLLALALGQSSESLGAEAVAPVLPDAPARIGPYRILETLGEGGMGIVYLAEQDEPLRRRVAVKVIKLGMDTREVVARFESERQAVALMDHPNIAAVHDAGATEDGRPYFVMEYVPGIPITEYCDRHRLDTRERLRLFTGVCAAIQHAHQKGIIHRDLKPTNVLVMEQDARSVPKVIDFGVAKAIDQRLTERTLFTAHGLLVGTPEYMSPEQASLGASLQDTRTDIYSLGVLLYELLVGALPFEIRGLRRAGYDELRRVIREEEPVRPSTKVDTLGADAMVIAERRDTDRTTLRRQLRGDLDWITMKALDKDPARRYASASEFAADVDRHLGDEPVFAGPPSTVYRLRKFVRKHRGPVTAVAAIVALLLSGFSGITALYVRATAARQEAERQRFEAQRSAYAANIALVDASLQSLNTHEAFRRLELTEPSLRGWEWYYLFTKADGMLAELAAYGAYRFPRFPSVVSNFAFSRDGVRVAWNTERTVHVWDTASYRPIATYGGSESILALAPDASLAVIKSLDRRADFMLAVIDPLSRKHVATLVGPAQEPTHTVFSWDARRVATGGADGIQIWNVDSGALISRISSPAVSVIAFSPDGARIAAASESTIRVLDTTSGVLTNAFRGHVAAVTAVAFSADGQRIASGSEDRSVHIWDVHSGRPLATLTGHTDSVSAVAFSPDGMKVVSGGMDYTVRLWDARTGRALAGWPSQSRLVASVAFDPAGHRVFSAAYGRSGGVVRVWNAFTGVIPAFDDDEQASGPIAISPDGRDIVVGSESGTLRSVAAENGTTRWMIRGHEAAVTGLAYDPSGNRIASVSGDRTVKVWESSSGQPLATLTGHTEIISAIAFSPAGDELASGSIDKTVRIWNSRSGRLLAQLGLEDQVNAVAFTADGTVVIGSGSPARFVRGRLTARLWQWRSGLVSGGVDSREGGAVMSVAVSRDGRRLAVAGWGAADVKVWSARLDRVLGTLSGHSKPVHGVAFSQDGSRLVTASSDETVRLWDADSYEPLLSLRYPRSRSFDALALSPQGSRIAALADKRIHMWDTRRSSLLPEARQIVPRLYEQLVFSSDVLEHLRSDRTLSPEIREAAIKVVESWGDSPRQLYEDSWDVVKASRADQTAYHLALRRAELAVKLAPWERKFLTALGAAYYRLGEYERTLVMLLKEAELAPEERAGLPADDDPYREPPTGPRLKVFIAMAHYRLGQTAAARRVLDELRVDANRRTERNQDQDLLTLLREAEALIAAPAKAPSR